MLPSMILFLYLFILMFKIISAVFSLFLSQKPLTWIPQNTLCALLEIGFSFSHVRGKWPWQSSRLIVRDLMQTCIVWSGSDLSGFNHDDHNYEEQHNDDKAYTRRELLKTDLF